MTYAGGKNGPGVYQTLINLMPPHRVYIEAFLGGGAVMRQKRPAEVNIGLDKDPEVIRWWNGLVASPKGARMDPNGGKVDSAGGIGRNGAGRSLNGGSAGARRRVSPNLPSGSSVGGIGAIGSPGPIVQHADAISFLRDYEFRGDEMLYCDPPYLMETRSAKKALYGCEMAEQEHRDLLKVLKRLPCHVMISGYSSVLYARELKSWNAYAFPASTRGGLAAEWVWCNYDRPTELHDYRYLGDNFRERENLKRMQRRWIGKLQRMNLLQRQALLSAIASTAHSAVAAGGR